VTATLHPGAGTALEFPAIRAALPQRYPLLLVDRVLDLRPGVRIETVKLVSATDPCYAGVPEQPGGPAAYRYPASLLIESFGQSAALLWLHGTGTGAGTDDAVLLFVAAREYEVHGHAYPGDTVRHVVELERVNARLTKRLERAELIISVQKKVSEILGISLPDSDENL